MKKVLTIFVLLFTCFLVIGCDKKEDKTIITFWHIWPVGDPAYSSIRSLVTEFNEQQDEYVVKATGYSFWDHIEKIRMALSTNMMPNVSIFTIDDVYQRATNNKLLNISELMANDPNHGIDMDDFFENQIKFSTYEGNLYALPFSATTRLLYYNLDMFKKAGLTEADVPTTWSELHTVAKKLDIIDSNGDIVQLGFEPSYGNVNYHSYLWQKGLDFFDEDLNVTLNTQGHVDVLNWVRDFNSDIPRTKLTAFGEQNATFGTSPFAAERVAMIVEVDDLHHRISEYGTTFEYGVTYIPIPDEDGIRVNWGSGFSLELYDTGSLTEQQKKGTWEFAKYLMTKEVQLKFAQSTGWLMANKKAMNEFVEGNELLTKVYEEVAYARDKIYVPYSPNWHGDFNPFWESFLNGDLTAIEALQQGTDYFNEKKQNWELTRK